MFGAGVYCGRTANFSNIWFGKEAQISLENLDVHKRSRIIFSLHKCHDTTTPGCPCFPFSSFLNSLLTNMMGLTLFAYSQTQRNPALLCECGVGLFPCSLSLAGGLHLKSQLCSLELTTLWEDHRTLPRTISWFTQLRLVLGGFHGGFVGLQSYSERGIREQQQTQV